MLLLKCFVNRNLSREIRNTVCHYIELHLTMILSLILNVLKRYLKDTSFSTKNADCTVCVDVFVRMWIKYHTFQLILIESVKAVETNVCLLRVWKLRMLHLTDEWESSVVKRCLDHIRCFKNASTEDTEWESCCLLHLIFYWNSTFDNLMNKI